MISEAISRLDVRRIAGIRVAVVAALLAYTVMTGIARADVVFWGNDVDPGSISWSDTDAVASGKLNTLPGTTQNIAGIAIDPATNTIFLGEH